MRGLDHDTLSRAPFLRPDSRCRCHGNEAWASGFLLPSPLLYTVLRQSRSRATSLRPGLTSPLPDSYLANIDSALPLSLRPGLTSSLPTSSPPF